MIFPNLDKQRRNNRIAIGIILAILLLGCLGVAGTCLIPPNPEAHVNRSMTEVETPAKEMGLTGTVLFMSSSDVVVAVDLATAARKTVFTCAKGFTVNELDGPNKNGIAIVTEYSYGSKKHRFSMLDLNTGKATLIFERPGHEFWTETVGAGPALAEEKNLVVYFDGDGETQLHDPEAFTITGNLVLLDLDKKSSDEIVQPAFQRPLAISSDGKSVFFEKGVDRNEARKLLRGTSVPNGSGPLSALFEWRDGVVRAFAAGGNTQTLARPDSVFFYDFDGTAISWNSTTQTSAEMAKPSYVSGVEEWLPEGTLLAVCPQTDPAKVVFVGDNFSRGVHALQRIVAINPEKGQIHTIVQTFDAEFDEWSYGAWSATASSQSQP